jgi:hypothetical protein
LECEVVVAAAAFGVAAGARRKGLVRGEAPHSPSSGSERLARIG